MSLVLGIDPASITGYALLDDGKLIDYGSITSSFTDIGQRLNFIADETARLLERIKPDYIAIENTIYVINITRHRLVPVGKKITKLLFNQV